MDFLHASEKISLDANDTNVVVRVSFLDHLIEFDELFSKRELVREEVGELEVFNFLVGSI